MMHLLLARRSSGSDSVPSWSGHVCSHLCLFALPHQLFYEVFACRDLIIHVLDAAGRRDEGMAALGGAIRRNQLAPSEFTPLLGSGLDAEAAVAALDK